MATGPEIGPGLESYRLYRGEVEGERLTRSTRTAAIVTITLSSAFIALDALAFPDRFLEFLAVRLGLNAVLGVIYLWTARRFPVGSAMLGCLAIGASLLAVIEGSGGLLGEYYVGLVLLFVGMPVFLPYSARQAAVLVSIMLGALALMPLADLPLDWRTYWLHLFFPAAAAVECVASCAVLDRFRFTDFIRRRELEEARDHLKQLDVEKSRFTANVHHELRTPLTLMLAPIEAMEAGEFGEMSQLQREYLGTVRTNGLRLLKLINNLLDLAKIEGNQLQIDRRRVELGGIVEELVAGARPLAERKGVRLTIVESGPHQVYVDPDAIEKVVVNLLGNALKFTEPGGSVSLSLQETDDGGAHFTVRDDGAGIPKNQLRRIFDRFAQVDGSNTRRHEGTGIGLALAKELVELHGGRIWAESEGEGRGATLHVQVPMGKEDLERPGATRGGHAALMRRETPIELTAGEIDAEGLPTGNLRTAEIEHHLARRGTGEPRTEVQHTAPADASEVLICEDNAEMRRLLADLLGREFRIRTARNGLEGLAEVRQKAPDLVLTDVMMPGMSGTSLCATIKRDPRLSSVPVVLITSKAEREMKIEGLEQGADDYISKPFHPRELLARVRSLARLRGLQADLASRNSLLEEKNQELGDALARLQEASVKLAQAERLAAIGELTAGIAHEINNPMNFALNALRTLDRYVRDIKEVAESASSHNTDEFEALKRDTGFEDCCDALFELVAIVSEGLDRTQRLVSDLKDLSSPGEGNKAETDVGEVLASTGRFVRRMLAERGVSLELAVEPGLPSVMADRQGLNQLFLNLVKNAAEAFEGREGIVEARARLEGGLIHVEISDNGPGIADEVRARVFEPFFTTKGAGEGSGLGLAISRRIVAAHGGTISLSSELGAGTTFVISLPVADGKDASSS